MRHMLRVAHKRAKERSPGDRARVARCCFIFDVEINQINGKLQISSADVQNIENARISI